MSEINTELKLINAEISPEAEIQKEDPEWIDTQAEIDKLREEIAENAKKLHKPVKFGRVERISFNKINEVLEMPNLIEIQKNSYNWLVERGIREVLNDISGITDSNKKYVLRFNSCHIDSTPKYSVAESKARDVTYAAPLKVKATLLNNETGDILENEVYMGDFPLMTESGTFIINGAERAIVSQLVRSPGVYYNYEHDKTGKKLFKATVIPNRGAWLEYEMDSNDVAYVRIDKNRKIPVTTFIRAISEEGADDEVFSLFGQDERILSTIKNKDQTRSRNDALIEVYRKLRPGEPPTVESSENLLRTLFFDPKKYDLARFGRYKYNKKLGIASRIFGHKSARNIVSPFTGEILLEEDKVITIEKAKEIEQAGVYETIIFAETDSGRKEVVVRGNRMVDIEPFLPPEINPLKYDINEKVSFPVLQEILESIDTSNIQEFENALAENADRLCPKYITHDDIYAATSYFLNLSEGVGVVDDIDHLGNRRIRSVGELLQNQLRLGFLRMERIVHERMGLQGGQANKEGEVKEKITPSSLINIRPVLACIKEFFGSSPLSQFMDQNNPLAELTHKRRLSALGPGGLSRDRAGFDVRDVHYSHYGRMCPIETPEGPNIGLISYLASFAKINEYGFIEAPYRKIDKETGVVLDEVRYMTADVEDLYVVAQANEPLTEKGTFANSRVTARYMDETISVPRESVDYMDVSPKMVVSVATAMIPFLENDDANRALMGANMQRQAVPLMITESPIVGTGMEYKAAVDSCVMVLSSVDGVVSNVCASNVKVKDEYGEEHSHPIVKFKRSNQGTCINQRVCVNKGDVVKKGDLLADGPATCDGEISLGKNALIGFMTWEGYNYEDAVLLSEKLVYNDVFTSIHIEEYEIECRETKLGKEEITREIPNIGEDALKNLDERGIIRIGAEVQSGDILVGKVTPKGESELSAEEKLLRAIFGEKAREVRDTSLKVPHGESGIIVDVRVFDKDNCDEIAANVNMVVKCYIGQKRKISVGDKMAGRHGNKGVVSRILPVEDMPFLPDGTPLDIVLNPLGVPSRMNIGQVLEVHLGLAAKTLGLKVMTPVFDGAREDDITALIKEAQKINPAIRDDAKIQLTDGRTGEKFDSPVTAGYLYYLKLHHLVDDKIHARSTGPYSLVTQQPLGGKAQFGGQRFGEMEVWALEAYGAAYTLQEILTVKSDDIVGRVKTYEAIVNNLEIPKPGVPESFCVLVKELQSLGLDISVLDKDGTEIDLRQKFEEDEESPIDFSAITGETVAVDSEIAKSSLISETPGADPHSALERSIQDPRSRPARTRNTLPGLGEGLPDLDLIDDEYDIPRRKASHGKTIFTTSGSSFEEFTDDDLDNEDDIDNNYTDEDEFESSKGDDDDDFSELSDEFDEDINYSDDITGEIEKVFAEVKGFDEKEDDAIAKSLKNILSVSGELDENDSSEI